MAAPMARRRTAIAAALFAAAIAAIGGAGRGASGAFAVAAPKSLKETPWEAYALRLLRSAPFFSDLTDQQRRETAEMMMLQAVEENETVFQQGDPGDKFFIIIDGEVKAFVQRDGEDSSGKVEEMVKHYLTGEYFGELALLTSAPRRATIRNSKDGQTLLLYLTRVDFEKTMGSMRELLLRNAAYRPAQKAQEQERRLVEASTFEQILGLSGSLRRFLLTTVLYLSLGTAFYTFTGFEELPGITSPVVAFYFSVETALAVGFGVLTPRGAWSAFFTAGFVISGAAILVNFLSGVVADLLEDAAEKRPWAPSASGRWSLIFSLLPLLCWWLVGTAFGRVHEGWGWSRAVLFAISATSTVGIQGLDSKDELSLLFCAIYLLVGVPLYASVLARVSLLVANELVKRRQKEIRQRAIQAMDGCDDECRLDVFSMYDTDQDGRINKQEMPELLRFLCATRQLEITDADLEFLIREWDEDKTETITQQEFLAGLRQWQATESEQGGR